MSQKSTKIARTVFILLGIAIVIIGIPWASGVTFLHVNGADPALAGPFSIIEYWKLYAHSSEKFVRVSVQLCAIGPWALLAGFIGWAVIAKQNRPLHGAARFANTAEIRKAGLLDPKGGLDKTILVGKKNGRYLTYGGYQFVILAAPTRSGKGVGIVVPNCLNYSDSLVVLDIKGENFDITSGFRAKHGQKVYLFAPFDEAGVTHRYNPLEYISDDPAQRLGDIDAIGTALYSGGNQNDKFWSENAKDLFRGLCLFVLERKDLPKTFGEILRQASGKGKPLKEYIFEELKKAQDTGHPFSNACIDCLNRVLSNSENTLAGIVATFGTPLLIFQNPRVDLATSANDFDLREVRRERMSIYFKMPPNKLKEGSVLVNLFFDQLLNLNTRVLPSQDKTLKQQCLVLLDEMTSIGKVAMIAQAVSYMAGYNMRLLTIIQNKSQLEDVYGKAGALTLLSNHALMVMYAPSPTVQSDAQEYSEMLGYETVKSRSRTSSMQSSSTSTSDQRRALMLPQEIRELGQTREIVSLENCKPILCDKIRYYEDPDFTCRAHLPPPSIPKQDIDTFIAKIENRTRPMTAGEMAAPSEAAAKVVLEGLQELPQSAVAWGQDEVESFVDFDVQAALSSLTFAPRTEVPRGISSDGIADQETKDALVADIFDVTDTDSNETSESLQNSGPATVADAITDLADHLTASEDEVAESSDELDTDTAAEDSADADTADLQRTLESIDALMNPTDATKAELPIEKFYSKTAVRDTRRVGS
ncbi:type IV secretory system conjugative DNA transfer family protein [Sutterella wadsworthensis]|jgi:type IV secretion system protein VirD4|uniref:type IV secretory system conjugative DNA transfer family protein n=1 Tax=Sutterella wadsworthensis TaxID=40545 RepID=UPI0013F5C418|nr:type IV secretory system conjugative DNA transfer family protein [Sutterella wadsworthensis]MBT9623149.1 TraM recognition domain-containing protein [Sutterella wadsworthensis]